MSEILYLISISDIFRYLSSAESFTNPVVLEQVQACFGDIAGSVPDRRNKASQTNLWFPSAYKSYV
jgi:hypothetical protein